MIHLSPNFYWNDSGKRSFFRFLQSFHDVLSPNSYWNDSGKWSVFGVPRVKKRVFFVWYFGPISMNPDFAKISGCSGPWPTFGKVRVFCIFWNSIKSTFHSESPTKVKKTWKLKNRVFWPLFDDLFVRVQRENLIEKHANLASCKNGRISFKKTRFLSGFWVFWLFWGIFEVFLGFLNKILGGFSLEGQNLQFLGRIDMLFLVYFFWAIAIGFLRPYTYGFLTFFE